MSGKVWKGNPGLEPLLVPIKPLIVHPENERKHPRRNIDAIKASLSRWGQQSNINVSPSDKKSVLKGNGTILAMREMGWTHVAALVFDQDEEGEQRAYRIVDNRTGELAEWGLEQLSPSLLQLAQSEFPLAEFGFEAGPFAYYTEGWQTAPKDPTKLPSYDPNKETFTIKIEGIPATDKEKVLELITKALEGLPYEATAY